MKGTTWAAVAAGNQVQSPASTVIPTDKQAQPSAGTKNGQISAAVKTESHTLNTSAVDNIVPKKDVTAGVKSIVVVVPGKTPARKSNKKKKKKNSVSVSKPHDAIIEKALEVPDVATSSVGGASRKSSTSKKKKPYANAAESTGGNSSKQLDTKNQTNGKEFFPPVANEASTASANKTKKKNKLWTPRNKVKDADKVADEIKQTTPEPSNVASGVEQQVPESNIYDPLHEATTADKLDAAPADLDREILENDSTVQYTYTSTGTSEAAPALVPSIIEGPTLASLPLVENEPLKQPEPSAYTHKHSESTESLLRVVQDVVVPRARSVVVRRRITKRDVGKYVASLNLPGISFDEHGICIAPDAPEWVRGRVARRVQCLVWDFEAGKTPAEVDIATELELEKKEKVHFHKAVWDYLFKVEDRDKTSGKEKLELRRILREFDVKLAAGLVPDFPATQVGDDVGKQEFLDKVEDNATLSLPMQEAESRSFFHEQNTIQHDRGNNDLLVPPPDLHLPSQVPLSPNSFVSGSRSSVQTTINGPSYTEYFIPEPPPPQEDSQNPQQQHRQTSRQPCRDYADGYCYWGASCHFSHAYPREVQAVAEPYRRDSAYIVFNPSRYVSRSSNGTGMAGPLNAHSNDWGHAPSRMSGNTHPSARLTPDSHGSVQLSVQGPAQETLGGYRANDNTQKRKKKGGAKHKGGRKSQDVNQ
ncbi:hypothetical protein P171DRAFT_490330 [Karstenula rhodostoma CBS 690.94]|uniref:C3H1-type domain-containing protein n=1 Tax=Karstenula rhodostoma CBS 690.94 TaxID=1392251 RepID=A0A9P4PAI4_9PLEO|nr:hypothetical protein P171DRAFT_490330 [Karstenula rhodostoma CBS 690.94]